MEFLAELVKQAERVGSESLGCRDNRRNRHTSKTNILNQNAQSYRC